MSELDNTIQQILSNNLFKRLKHIVENINGWHDHEDVYSHSLATMDRANKFVKGEFIHDSYAREKFYNWMEEEIYGMKRKDVLILVALLHDCGKILSYTENNTTYPLITVLSSTDQTWCPGHEYYGGEIVAPKILKEIDLTPEINKYICTLIKLHGIFNGFFFGKEKWEITDLVLQSKAQAEGLYKEAMFNSYCDCFTASAFANPKQKIEEVFNQIELYTSRKYFINE